MEITLTEQDGIPIIKLSGEIDLYNSNQITKAISDLMEQEKTKMVIDLDQVSYIDSSGLGTFIGNLKKLTQAGGGLKFVNVSESMHKLFELTNLTTYLEFHGTPEEAIAAFRN